MAGFIKILGVENVKKLKRDKLVTNDGKVIRVSSPTNTVKLDIPTVDDIAFIADKIIIKTKEQTEEVIQNPEKEFLGLEFNLNIPDDIPNEGNNIYISIDLGSMEVI